MRDSGLHLYFLGTTLLLFCGFAIHLLVQERDGSPQPAVQEPARVMRLLSDFTYEAYDANQLVNVLEADDLRVNPRRLAFFNIRKVNELTLTNARFKVYLHEGVSTALDPLSMVKSTLAFQGGEGGGGGADWPKNFGLISRQVIVGLDQKIYEGEDLKMHVLAKQVYIDRTENPEYLDTTLSDPRSQQRIVCRRAIWDRQRSVFRIPGAYLLSNAGVEHRGRRIQVDMDFIVQPL